MFTEICGEAGTNLDGWSLIGINGSSGLTYQTIDLTRAVIPGDSILLVAQSSPEPLLAGMRDFIGNVDWQNGPDAVQLLNPLSRIVDALRYADAGAFNAGEGVPAPDAYGIKLGRNAFAADSNDNFTDSLVSMPSPGIGPPPLAPTPIPEPSTLLLFGTGTAAVEWRLRARSRGEVSPRIGSPTR